MARAQLDDTPEEQPSSGGLYFTAPSPVEKFSTGCTLLDCVLGGGIAEGRILNIVGDKSTGKTLLAIEASVNFLQKYPKARIKYRESEAAFDPSYAAALGLPISRVDFLDSFVTVEQFHNDLVEVCKEAKKTKVPALYIVDSLDALSDEQEMERRIDESASYSSKAKQMSEIMRRVVREVEESNVTLVIISQVRDNIGVTFGESHTRSGGKALDFYASQVLWLANVGKVEREKEKIKRVTSIKIKARCKKNKIGLPLRECEFPIRFGFGIDDVTAGIDFLTAASQLELVGLDEEKAKRLLRGIHDYPIEDYKKIRGDVNEAVVKVWYEIEKQFMPSRSKY